MCLQLAAGAADALPASGGWLIQYPSGKYARRLSSVSNLPTSRHHPASGPVRQGGLCHASTHVQSRASAQARHGAATHRNRLALARPLDHPATLFRAHPHPRAPSRSQQTASPRTPACPRNTVPWATATTPTATNASPRCAYATAGWNNSASPSARSGVRFTSGDKPAG